MVVAVRANERGEVDKAAVGAWEAVLASMECTSVTDPVGRGDGGCIRVTHSATSLAM